MRNRGNQIITPDAGFRIGNTQLQNPKAGGRINNNQQPGKHKAVSELFDERAFHPRARDRIQQKIP